MWFHAKARKLTTWVEEWRLLQQKNKIRRTWGVRTASHTVPQKASSFEPAQFPNFQSLGHGESISS